MLSLTYSYRIYPDLTQEARMLTWMERCRRVYNYALAERRDWIASRKCAVNACSIKQEYIIPADTPYPDSRGILAKHCLDAGWGCFLEILGWICRKRGVYFDKVNPNGTSQTCPNCGTHTGKKDLGLRVHHCDECGYITDRDVAAAIVVEQRGLTAVGQTVVLPVEVNRLGVPVKQESLKSDLCKPTLSA